MQKLWRWVSLYALVCTSVMPAQSAKDMERSLKDSLLKKQLVLRNFSGEDQVHAVWNGTSLEFDESPWSKAAAVEINSVRYRDQQIVMQGLRHTLLYDRSGRLALFDDAEPVEIDIDVPPGIDEQAALRIENALFFPSNEEALAAIPERYRSFIPYRMVQEKQPASAEKAECKMKPPIAVRTPDPEMTDRMRKEGYSGAVVVALIVSMSGRPENLWVAQSGGHDANEQAVRVVSQYQFRPATCDGEPRDAVLRVQVSFEMFPGRRY